MDNRSHPQYDSVSAVSSYLSPMPYASNAGPYYDTSMNQVGYGYSPSPSTVNSVPSNLTLISCSERAIAKERRREQNRASQRAYRQRKDKAVKGLYDSIRELQKGAEQLKVENGGLKGRNDELQTELNKLLAENRHLKRKRSTSHASHASFSKSSVSRRSSCTQCQDTDLDIDHKGTSPCQRCLKTDASCASSVPELEGSLSSTTDATTDATADPPDDLQNKLDLDLDDGLRTFYLDFDSETQNNLLFPAAAPGALQAIDFSALDNLGDWPTSASTSEQFSPTDAQHISQVPQPRPLGGDLSISYRSFASQADANSSITNRASFNESGMANVMGCKDGTSGQFLTTFEPARRRKSS